MAAITRVVSRKSEESDDETPMFHAEQFVTISACVAVAVGAAPARAHAQARDPAPCCMVVRVDTAHAIVTARETATGFTFRVEVRAKRALASLKVGDKVWANFTAKKVRLAAGDSLCCPILDGPPPSGRPVHP